MTHDGGYGQQDPREQWPPQYQQPWEQGQQVGPWPQPGYQPPQGPPGWQQPGYGQQPPWGPPPGPPRRKRHTARNVLLGAGGLVAAIIVIAVAANGGKTGSTGASATSSSVASGVASAETAAQNCTASGGTWNGTSCQAPAPSPSNTPASPTKVEFIVSGTAPDGIDITYGPSGSNFEGPSTLDGTATMSVPFDGSARLLRDRRAAPGRRIDHVQDRRHRSGRRAAYGVLGRGERGLQHLRRAGRAH